MKHLAETPGAFFLAVRKKYEKVDAGSRSENAMLTPWLLQLSHALITLSSGNGPCGCCQCLVLGLSVSVRTRGRGFCDVPTESFGARLALLAGDLRGSPPSGAGLGRCSGDQYVRLK